MYRLGMCVICFKDVTSQTENNCNLEQTVTKPAVVTVSLHMLTQAHLAGIDRYKTVQGTIRADSPLVSFKRLRYSSCSKYCRVAMYDETGTPCSSLAVFFSQSLCSRISPHFPSQIEFMGEISKTIATHPHD